jgi:hypothetical protein
VLGTPENSGTLYALVFFRIIQDHAMFEGAQVHPEGQERRSLSWSKHHS